MKLRPQKEQIDVDYPSCKDYSQIKHRELLKILTAVGISVSAAVSPQLHAEERRKKDIVGCTSEHIFIEIDKLAADLGHEDFKKREKATIALIALGKASTKDKEGKEIPNKVVREAVISSMKKFKKAKDPEVKQRAKRILIAISPTQKEANKFPVRRIFRTLGVVAPPRK